MRVLLLNPPGRRVYLRDYSCSKTSKASYLFHPIDLLVLSGVVASRHTVVVLDCIAEGLGPAAARARIDAFDPDALVALVGSVSWNEDRAFLAEQAGLGRRVLALGDLLQDESEARLAEEPWIEAALHDFTRDDVLRCLDGATEGLADATVRLADGAIARLRGGARGGSYAVPRPLHELFPQQGYRFPFARAERFATVLSDYGCPHPCTFCIMGTLGHRTRPLADVLEELDHLRARGVREVFFRDQTFGLSRPRALELCAQLARRGDLSWTAFTRPDLADDGLCSAMARAGCHTLILGVESGDEAQLERYRKGYGLAEIRAGFAAARRHGLRRAGTFILGLPEETEESLSATLALALELELDFLSVNVATPRLGTPFRRRALELGLADPAQLTMDSGGASASLRSLTLSRERVLAGKRAMVRRFYLRPRYLWRRVRALRSPWELRSQVRDGLALLRRNLAPPAPALGAGRRWRA